MDNYGIHVDEGKLLRHTFVVVDCSTQLQSLVVNSMSVCVCVDKTMAIALTAMRQIFYTPTIPLTAFEAGNRCVRLTCVCVAFQIVTFLLAS